jgi:PKD repeat protein
VKDESEDKILNELFRRKLENAELTPSPSVGSRLMRKMAIREFIHFIPGKFNIWYTGIATVAVTAVVYFLLPGRAGNIKEEPEKETGKASMYIMPDTIKQVPVVKEAESAPATDSSETKRKSARDPGKPGKVKDISRGQVNDMNRVKGKISPSTVTISPRNGMAHDDGTRSGKLRELPATGKSFIAASGFEGCAPLTVILKNRLTDSDSCSWDLGNGNFSGRNETEWVYHEPGEYTVTLKVFRTGSLPVISTTSIVVHPKPSAGFEIQTGNPLAVDDETKYQNLSLNAVRYTWYFGDGCISELPDPSHAYMKDGKYIVSLVAISEHGCRDSVTVVNEFSGSGHYIEFPNAFIPNPDGPSGGIYSNRSDESSQVFHPVSSGISEFQMRIYSKRGLLLFESNDINIGWDGYYKGQLSEPGVYVWKARGYFTNGKPFSRMGDLTLIKN